MLLSLPQDKKIDWSLFGETAFFGCLNLFDFVTDILVVLQFGCLYGGPLGTECPDISNSTNATSNAIGEQGLSGSETCKVHVWWLVISATIVFCSCAGSAMLYSSKPRGDNPKGRRAGQISFVMAFLQLSPFMDLLWMLRHGTGFMNDKKDQVKLREIVTKLFESAPQAFFQAYVLFATGAHDQPLRVLSMTTSIVSLTFSLVSSLDQLDKAETRFWKRLSEWWSDRQSRMTEDQLENMGTLSQLFRGALAGHLSKSDHPVGKVLDTLAETVEEEQHIRSSENRTYRQSIAAKPPQEVVETSPTGVVPMIYESPAGALPAWAWPREAEPHEEAGGQEDGEANKMHN